MIFKTITDEVTGANKSISLFGKTFNDFKTNIQNRGIKGIFTSGISNDDIKALQAYNADIRNGLSPQTAYYNNLQNCSDAAVKLAESAGNSEIPLEDLKKATTNMSLSAKAGSIALKGLAIAGNMLVGWGIGVVISAVANVIDDLVHSEENLCNSANELGSTLKSSESDISSYKTKIKELYKTINDSGSSVEDVAQARINLTPILFQTNFADIPIKGKIAVKKKSYDPTKKEYYPENNTTFQVYLKSKGSYDNCADDERATIKTDTDGYAVTGDLVYGT